MLLIVAISILISVLAGVQTGVVTVYVNVCPVDINPEARSFPEPIPVASNNTALPASKPYLQYYYFG